MPSSLVGLTRMLTWPDFKGNPIPGELAKLQAAAGPGHTVGMAAVLSDFTVHYGGVTPDEPVMNPIVGTSSFSLGDDIVITVKFDEMRSWKRIDPLTVLGEQFLLDHEQGHYDVTALMARDCFIDIMQLKAKQYSTAQEGQAEAKSVFKKYKNKLDPIQSKYDDDTNHGAWVSPSFLPERKEFAQLKWEGFFLAARTIDHIPTIVAPDGASYKLRLLDVLATGGFVF